MGDAGHQLMLNHCVKDTLAVLQQHPLLCIGHIFTGDDDEDSMDDWDNG
jgi:hypothetical protein